MHAHVCRKDDIFRQIRQNHSEMGDGDYWTQSHVAEPYSCLQVWVKTFNNNESLSIVETIKEASAVCQSFLDGVVISSFKLRGLYCLLQMIRSGQMCIFFWILLYNSNSFQHPIYYCIRELFNINLLPLYNFYFFLFDFLDFDRFTGDTQVL